MDPHASVEYSNTSFTLFHFYVRYISVALLENYFHVNVRIIRIM